MNKARVELQPKPHIANCVGFECPERGSCLRYLRPAWRPPRPKPGEKIVLQKWASYDIERARFGDCPSKIVASPMQQAMLKVA